MKTCWQYFLVLLLLCQIILKPANVEAADLETGFIVKPYLQLGNHPRLNNKENLELFWMVASNQNKWDLLVKTDKSAQWSEQKPAKAIVISYSVPDKLYLFDNQIENLNPGEKFAYKLMENGHQVFYGEGTARKNHDQPFRFALFGDTGADTSSERKIVYQTYMHKPDLLVIAGDIVYSFGCLSEYLAKFFPIFNSDKASEQQGAPLLQSTITVPVIGNHDIAYGDNKSGINLDKLRDALAFYEVWSAPLNGPLKSQHGHNIPKLLGGTENIDKYLLTAGSRYPTMSNYSFDYGNSHWLILDANPYMDWTDQKLRNWVRNDLLAAKGQTWKFVCFHQPGFSIDKAHSREQRMRLLSDIFQDCGVDVVFSGHAHDYQRSFPLVFKAMQKNGKPFSNADGTVSGEFVLDKEFDGAKKSAPKGVIYIVSGGGGAALYGSIKETKGNVETADQVTFTDKFIAFTHSLTLCEVSGQTFTLSQISEDGKVLDRIYITKGMSQPITNSL